MDEAEFRQQVQAEGYAEPERRVYPSNHPGKDLHTHDISVFAFVVDGAFTVVTEAGAETHRAGETRKVPAGTLHTERTGAEGATVLLARK
ncbi:MAG: hypothetical protein OXR84_02890 [Magnetovibrio sp.]|nr:hypothetical protein [Magnetovibrio sp.]